MKIALFGGSFDPVHKEHVRAVRAAISALSLDKVLIVPSHLAPHKHGGAHASGEERLAMCRLAFAEIAEAEVSDYEIQKSGTSFSYLTCRHFREVYRDDELFFLVGADMLADFFTWKNPADILSNVTLCAFGRGEDGADGLHGRFLATFGTDYLALPHCGEKVSSTDLRVRLAFGLSPEALPESVIGYVRGRGLYTHPAIAPALVLESSKRREHSFRVALMAARRARSLGVSEDKAILACALHDCAKNLPSDSPLLKNFNPPEGVPEPVLHQYAGAYLAEKKFGITDAEVLDAIRFHTSGRENMTELGKLVFLADLLEEGRTFSGVEKLRELFSTDFEACFLRSLQEQIAYLAESGKEVFPLTKRAYEWAKSHSNG